MGAVKAQYTVFKEFYIFLESECTQSYIKHTSMRLIKGFFFFFYMTWNLRTHLWEAGVNFVYIFNVFPQFKSLKLSPGKKYNHNNKPHKQNKQRVHLPHTVSIGMQSKVAVIPDAAPATNLSKFVVSSFPVNFIS